MPEKKGQQAIFIVRTYMYFSMQENKKRHDTRLLADGCTSVCRNRGHPKILTVTAVARSVRGRERSPTRSSLRRAAARSSIETSSARDELIDLAEGLSEGLNPGF